MGMGLSGEGGIGFGVERDFLLSVFMEEEEEVVSSSMVRYCAGPGDISEFYIWRRLESWI